ncbi:hypothetical protein [Parasphingorhabdus halotolerans]|uniref:DUF429 domain-containing protein n=1 Tax=Parasphingorhabdus halotolerans TaxID=2725558 RepID=A0A6H2DKK0_9SPHN|nr:hypothetical protein [Parasphingorhabdus halotolerans]QJB68513.1 hypothetical protein HF685_03755 [Parasphingorhabdus halotolerans]
MRRFSQYACVDWSGANIERPAGIAVATIGSVGPPALVPASQTGSANPRWSRDDIRGWLITLAGNHQDILIGFDLSMGFPFLDEDTYFPEWHSSPTSARALWELVDGICATDPFFGVASFLDHPQASRHFRHGKGYLGDLFRGGTGRLRVVEQHQRETGQGNSASCFNLVGASQVGKSSLTGMRMLHQLTGAIPIWPFDPLPQRGPVIVEIYTTIAALAAGLPKGKSKVRDRTGLKQALGNLGTPCPPRLLSYDDHSTDALITAAWMKQVAGDTRLWEPSKLTDEIAQKEGWTFGVV